MPVIRYKRKNFRKTYDKHVVRTCLTCCYATVGIAICTCTRPSILHQTVQRAANRTCDRWRKERQI